jgi:hypothetical protein
MKSLKEIVEATRGHNLQSARLNPPQINGLAAGDLPSNPTAGSLAEIVFVSPPHADCEAQAETPADVVPVATCPASPSTSVPPHEIDVQLPGDYDLATDDSIQRLEKLGPPKLEVIQLIQEKSAESSCSKTVPSQSDTKAEPENSTDPSSPLPQPKTQESQEETTECRPETPATEPSITESHNTESHNTESHNTGPLVSEPRMAEIQQTKQAPATQSDDGASDNSPVQSDDRFLPTSSQDAALTSTASREPGTEEKQRVSNSWVRPKSIAVEQIAQRLRDSIPIQHATSLLLVTSGSNQRFRTAAQDLALALTAQLHRPGVFTQISTSDQDKVVRPASVAENTTSCDDDWQSVATDYRFQQNGQLSVIEVVVERQMLQKAHHNFSAVVKKQGESHEFSLWAADHSDKELVQYLTGVCDATLVLVDLGHSSVSDCRLAVTQLREHGSRLLGTVVLSETKGRSSWVKS